MGIFRNPTEVAKQAQTPTIFFVAWVLGGLVSLMGALTYAEIGSRFPVKGGYYKIFSYAYHPAFAFMVNWMIVITNAGSTAIVALVGAEYINPLILPASLQNSLGLKITATITVLILYAVNLMGLRLSSKTLNVLSMFKFGIMLLLIMSVFFAPAMPVTSVQSSMSLWSMDGVKALALSFVPIFFTYGGYQNTINLGGDIEKPSQTIPRGIFWGFAAVLFLYLTINYAYYRVLGFEGIQQTPSLPAALAKVFFGEWGFRLTSGLLFVSVLTFINSVMIYNPRIYFAMADDGVLPAIFKRTNPKTDVQVFALTVFVGFLVMILWFADSFRELLNYVMVFDSIGMVTSAATIFLLRKRQSNNEDEIYKIGFGKIIFPVVFILIYFITAMSALLSSSTQNILISIGLFVAGLPLYFLMRKAIN